MRQRILLLMMSAFVFLQINAGANDRVKHYISLWGAGEYVGLNDSITTPGIGGGAFVGVGYELQYKHLLFTVGLEGNYLFTRNKIADFTADVPMCDTEGDDFTGKHSFSNFKNDCQSVNFNIPIMLGAQYGSFYFLAGVKPIVNFYGKTSASTNLSLSADYEKFIGEFSRMDNHSLGDYYLENKDQNIKFNFNANAVLELGYLFDPVLSETGYDVKVSKIKYRIGIFGEYGALNIHKNVSNGPLWEPVGGGSVAPSYDLVPLYISENAKDLKVHNFSVGVKFTVLFQMPEKKTCVICWF